MALVHSAALAKDLGRHGAVFPIIEKDALSEMEERAKQVDWEKALKKDEAESKIKNFKPKDMKNLPRAVESRTYTVDISYTLEHDIPDGQGGVLYPKGFTFNPLDYVDYQRTLVFINGSDLDQVKWFKGSKYLPDQQVTLIITDGNYWELMKDFKRPVFYSIRGISERLKLQYVPSIVQQRGKVMEITELAIEKAK